jgi:hypothetical protein
MKAFLVKQADGSFMDTVVRAHDAEDAEKLLQGVNDAEIGEISSNVADSMGAPDKRGRHDGSLSRWIIGPTTNLGDLIRNR